MSEDLKFVKSCPFIIKILSKNQILTSIKGHNCCKFAKNDALQSQRRSCRQNFVPFCQFVLKILSKNQILKWIKGGNSVVNLRKTMIYDTNVDLGNNNVHTKFGLILSIRSQDIE